MHFAPESGCRGVDLEVLVDMFGEDESSWAFAGVGKRLEVSDEDRVELERIVRAASSEVRIVGIRAQAHAILARAAIKPHLTDYWIMSDFAAPEFEQRCQTVCGL